MKWMGWISCVLLIGLLAGINVSGSKKLAAEKARLERNASNAEQSEANLKTTLQSRRAAVEGHIATKKKELAAAKAAVKELEAKHGPLLREAGQLEAKRMETTRAARTAVAASQQDAWDRKPAADPIRAAAPAAADRRMTDLQNEIDALRAELARIKLR